MGDVLDRRGAAVERIHVYRRVARDLPAETAERIESARELTTLGASLEAVTGLVKGLPAAAARRLYDAPLVVPSQRVAEHAQKMGFKRCRVASGASDEAMLAELSRLTSR
jgi:uroporphyrinogen-III synthase